MQVTQSTTDKLRLTDLDKLDSVTVYIEDLAPGCGMITIVCFGQAWNALWPAMGTDTLAEFFCSANEAYLANKLSTVPERVIDYDTLDEQLGIEDSKGMMEYNSDLLAAHMDCEPHEYDFPMMTNPDYAYLCRIITSVQAAFREVGLA